MKCIITLFSFLVFSTANVMSQDTTQVGSISPEFSSFKGVLLVVRNTTFRDNLVNKMTEKRFEKNYKGEYEIIDEDDLASKLYKNTTKYRFTVQLLVGRFVTRGGPNGGMANDNSQFVMKDRVNNTTYKTRVYTDWTKAMNQYTKALEEARNK